MKNIIQGIKNLIAYFNLVWNDRDFDYGFTLEFLKFKLEKQRDYFKKSQITEDNGEIEQIEEVIVLLDRMLEGYYETECELFECKDYLTVEDIEKLNTDNRQMTDLTYRILAQEKNDLEVFNKLSKNIKGWWD